MAFRIHRNWIFVALAMSLLMGGSQSAWAHAILMESNPAANSTVSGPDFSVTLRYNVRIDGSRSRLHLIAADGAVTTLAFAKQTAPDTLQASAKGLKPGSYTLRWQVLASDGHMSRGDVLFTVK